MSLGKGSRKAGMSPPELEGDGSQDSGLEEGTPESRMRASWRGWGEGAAGGSGPGGRVPKDEAGGWRRM